MQLVSTEHTTTEQIALPAHAKYFPGLDDASLTPPQLRSIQVLQRAIQGGTGDPVFARLVAYVMHNILEDFKPRKLRSKSGKVHGVILPLSASDKHCVTVCFIPKNSRAIRVCDVGVTKSSSPDREDPAPALWVKETIRRVSDAVRSNGVMSLLYRKHSGLTICERPDADIKALLNTPRMASILQYELLDRLNAHLSWAKILGVGGPGSACLSEAELGTKLQRGLIRLASEHSRKELAGLIDSAAPHIYESLRGSSQCYLGDIKKALQAGDLQAQTKRARWFASFPLYRSLANYPIALSHIDSDRLTVARLAERTGASQAHIRRVMEWPASTLEKAGVSDPIVFTNLLAQVNINHLPQYKKVSREELSALASTVAGVHEVVKTIPDGQLGTAIAQNLLKNAAGKWSQQTTYRLVAELEEAGDFIQTFSRRTVLAALLRTKPIADLVFRPYRVNEIGLSIGNAVSGTGALPQLEQLATNFLLAGLSGSWSLANLLQASRSWHEVVGKLGFLGSLKLQMWPALSEPVEAPNGLQLVPLTSSSELVAEGNLMSHCVGGYTSKCLSGDSHILSIRDPEGKHLSTLQLVQEGRMVLNAQNKAFANKAPSQAASQAADWYVEQVNSGQLVIDWDALSAEHSRAAASGEITQVLGYDATDSTIWNKSFSEFQGYCRGPLRAPTVEVFIRGLLQEVRRQNLPLGTAEATVLKLLEPEFGRR
jgi:hypothetical protein